MEFNKTVPNSEINTHRLKQVMEIHNNPLIYEIKDIFVTEPYEPFNPIISPIGNKKTIDLTITGIIKSKYLVNSDYVFNTKDYGIYNNELNFIVDDDDDELRTVYDEVMNITFHNIRVFKNIYIDSKYGFYQDYLKPVLVNDGYMTANCNDDVSMNITELKTAFHNRNVILNPVKVDKLNKKWTIMVGEGGNIGE